MPNDEDRRQKVSFIDWNKLLLDKENPRLPEALQEKSRHRILQYLYDREDLTELVDSMLENGFFDHEPLIVKRTEDAQGQESFVVLEGNRRLGALMIIHSADEAQGIAAVEDFVSYEGSIPENLIRVPCLVVDGYDEVRKFLGFRHIGGMKRWRAEAKARYLASEVRDAHLRGEARPFLSVAKEVGSNVPGVRNAYLASTILHRARAFRIDAGELERNRFGVWMRCLNSAGVRVFMGLDEKLPVTFEDAEIWLDQLDPKKLAQVVSDLTPPREGGGKPVLDDSRQASLYAEVLLHTRAHEVLRVTGRLDLAGQALRKGSFINRLGDESERCRLLAEEALEADWSPELDDAAKRLAITARSVYSNIKNLASLESDDY